jgi:hypothetical protein
MLVRIIIEAEVSDESFDDAAQVEEFVKGELENGPRGLFEVIEIDAAEQA